MMAPWFFCISFLGDLFSFFSLLSKGLMSKDFCAWAQKLNRVKTNKTGNLIDHSLMLNKETASTFYNYNPGGFYNKFSRVEILTTKDTKIFSQRAQRILTTKDTKWIHKVHDLVSLVVLSALCGPFLLDWSNFWSQRTQSEYTKDTKNLHKEYTQREYYNKLECKM